MKKNLVFSMVLAATAVSFPALAESGPMPQGTFTVGAERLTGIVHGTIKNDPFPGQNPNAGDEDGITSVAFLGNGLFSADDSRSMFFMPRVGFDYFIIDGLSLGGSFTVHTISDNDEDSANDVSFTNILFAPRVGYAYMFGDVVGIWPRGGISYVHGSVDPDQGGGASSHYFAFEIDVPLIIAPVKNFGITVGPLFDVTLGGSQTERLPPPEHTRDASLVLFGLSAGIMGIF